MPREGLPQDLPLRGPDPRPTAVNNTAASSNSSDATHFCRKTYPRPRRRSTSVPEINISVALARPTICGNKNIPPTAV